MHQVGVIGLDKELCFCTCAVIYVLVHTCMHVCMCVCGMKLFMFNDINLQGYRSHMGVGVSLNCDTALAYYSKVAKEGMSVLYW